MCMSVIGRASARKFSVSVNIGVQLLHTVCTTFAIHPSLFFHLHGVGSQRQSAKQEVWHMGL